MDTTLNRSHDHPLYQYDKPAYREEEIRSLRGDDLRVAIAEALEEDIVFGRLLPKERLIEEDLSARFGVKRYVLRQALEELEWLGLVQRVRNRGSVVRLYSVKEVEDINAVREVVEAEAARQLKLPFAPEDIAALEKIQEYHSAASERGDLRAIFRSNIAFHKSLFSHCPNKALVEVIDLLARKSHAYRSIFTNKAEYLRWVIDSHWAIIDAVRSSDRERLVLLCRSHLAPAKNHYIEMYSTPNDPSALRTSQS
ncbi:GntR family transcriptional regulator [Nitratireductor sp. ZSWI3]|uniref:GntR family transcriptional regulator n=1 Tax=Nitratireductor sp. ZSWI3 TaxID=2966359 RepID=UPI00214FFF0F|nr:GntR family transcriptional regulator [Nitratireductor sp. ZSWI3]MCR4265204.1 GntR family transcriptional regulator [Nitratireductor sp. ZSWI3]